MVENIRGKTSKRKYRGLVEHTTDAIIGLGLDGHISSFNKMAETMFGYKEGEVIGEPQSILVPKDYAYACRGYLKIATIEGYVKEAETRRVRKDGKIFIAEMTLATIIDDKGDHIGFVSILRDITERKRAEEALRESEERFRSLFNQASDCIFLLDPSHEEGPVIVDANISACKLHGYSRNQLIGKPLTFLDDPESTEKAPERLRLLMTGKPLTFEINHVRKDGSKFPVEVSARLIKIGRKKYIQSIDRDITERKKAHEALKNAYEELKSLDELKTNLVANVSHELRTPLTIVGGALELAKEEEDRDRRNELLEMAEDAIAGQNSIIGDLIEAAHLRKVDKKLKDVDLANSIDFVCGEFSPLITQQEIKMNVHVQKGLPHVRVDIKQLRHVLRNLISNAIKFNKKGGKISVKAKKKGKFVEVSVADTGIGIAKDKTSKIFDRFYQIDATASRGYGGTGLGLAVAKEIIEAHGGEISVESKFRKGTKFYFTLPTAFSFKKRKPPGKENTSSL